MKIENKNLAELKEFIKENYQQDYILLNDIFFDYFFKNYLSEKYSLRIIKIKDKIAGMLGLIPCIMNFFGKKIKSAYLVNLMVAENLRKAGIGPRLVLESQQDADIQIALSYGKKAKIMYNKLNWNEMSDLKRFIKIISRQEKKKLSFFSFEKIDFFPSDIDSFWNQIKNKYPITIERNKDYLNWRYFNHPLFNYSIFITKANEKIKAFIVLRIEDTPGYKYEKIGRIVDFISEDGAEEFTLDKLTEYCAEKKVGLVDFFFTGNFHINSLNKTGFRENNKRPYSLIPMLFNPIDKKKKSINFAFKIIDNKLFNKRVGDINNWYITKGDGDQDRPN